MSQAGVAFLKCAFAPPDFNVDPGQGIPDSFEGKTVVRKDVNTDAVTFAAGRDTYIMVLPTPGVAYWRCDTDSGATPSPTDVFTAHPYPGFPSMFGDDAHKRSRNVTAFRYASSAAGIYPTSNQMQFAGSITVWKFRVGLSMVNPSTTGYSMATINGLYGVNFPSNNNFATSFINGAFSQAICNEPEFEFSEVIEGVQTLHPSVETGLPFILDAGTADHAAITGVGNVDVMVFKISTPTGAVNSAILKTWACVEYRPSPISVLEEFAHNSPCLDQLALSEYRAIYNELPVAVTAAENAHLWERIKSIISGTLQLGSMIPGPIGVAASGLYGLSGLLAGLGI